MSVSKFIQRDRAAALVEFAMVAPILFLLLFGIVDFGRAFFTMNNLYSAVREGARFASVQGNPANTGAIQARVQQYVASFGGAAPTGTVTLDAAPPATSLITVSIVGYQFNPITPLPSMINQTLTTLPTVTAVYRWESAP